MNALDQRTDVAVGRLAVRLAAALAAGVLGLAANSSAKAATAYQQDSAHSGYSAQALDDLAPRWERSFGDDVIGYPLVADGRVIVVSWGETWTPELHAFDEQTGQPLWTTPIPTDYSLGDPVYDDGTVFLAVSGRIQQSTNVGYVDAYDATTGRRRWRSAPHDRSIFDTPLVAGGGKVFMAGASWGSSVLAFRQSDGGLLWDRQFGGGGGSSPALSASRIVVSHGSRTSAMSPADGTVSWARNGRLYGDYGRTPVIAGGRVYERDPNAEVGRIYAEATGSELAQFPLGYRNAPPPAVAPGTWVYMDGAQLIARRVGDNAELWRFTGDGALASAPLIVGDTVYAGSASGTLFGVSLATGAQTWSAQTGDPFRRFEDSQYTITPGLIASARSLAASGTHKLTVFGAQADPSQAEDHPAPIDDPVAGTPPATGSSSVAGSGASPSRPALDLTRQERAACVRYQGTLPRVSPGTDRRERILGTRRRDAIAAGDGPDRVAAAESADCVSGGRDRDRIDGGAGRDVLMGGPGNDTLVGGPGRDIVLCGAGQDTAYAGPGDRTGGCERVVRVRR